MSVVGQWGQVPLLGKFVGVTGSGQGSAPLADGPTAQLRPTADLAEHAQLPRFCFWFF